MAEEKMQSHHVKDKDKRGWGRLLVSAVGCYGTLLKDTELDQLQKDVEAIKEKVGIEPKT